MPTNSKSYTDKNRDHLNQRAKICYYNKQLKLDYDVIHEYEKENGLHKTILWLKEQAFYNKYLRKTT
jgi:hypothetical protein